MVVATAWSSIREAARAARIALPQTMIELGFNVVPVVRSKCCCDRIGIAEISYGSLQVDDRFGRQIGNRGGADVLDTCSQPGCEQHLQVTTFLLAPVGPAGVGVDDLNAVAQAGQD